MSKMVRIEQPTGETGLPFVWHSMLSNLFSALRGKWGGYNYQTVLTGTGTPSDLVYKRMGDMAWFTIGVTGASGNGSFVLPDQVDGDTAFKSINCVSFGLDGEAKAYIESASGDAVITGFYKVKEQ